MSRGEIVALVIVAAYFFIWTMCRAGKKGR